MIKFSNFLFILFVLITVPAYTQYSFKNVVDVESSAVVSQGKTGTCWSFATTSFVESELMRMGKGNIDISEMFTVRKVYENKAFNYVMRQGKANFSQGSLAHDMIRRISDAGVVPTSVYSGLDEGETVYNHSEMEKGLKGFLDGVIKNKKPSEKWQPAFNAILDVYMGDDVDRFTIDDMRFTPQSYAKFLGLDSKNYISLTSFSHHPFNTSFVLEIPDNYSNGSFYNVPLDDMIKTIDFALKNGYSIAWDGDVSEKGFSAKEGIAVLPTDAKRDDLYTKPSKEVEVTQENRQALFRSQVTTDDHLMHIVGTAVDQNKNKYYIIKNSWGAIGPYEGRIYMSESYMRMKTVSILLHKDGVPKNIVK